MTTNRAKQSQQKKVAKGRAGTGYKRKSKPVEKKKVTPRKRPAAKKKVRKSIAPKKPGKRKSPAISERPLFSIRDLAKLFGYAESTIREHINENDGPVEEKTGSGRAAKLDPAKWLQFFLDRQAGTSSPLLDARTEKIQFEAASKRLEHKLRAGEVIEVETVVEFFTEVALSIGTVLDGISGKSAEGDAVLRANFLNEVRNARTGIHRKIESYLGRITEGLEFNLTAPDSDVDGVGGSKKDAPKG